MAEELKNVYQTLKKLALATKRDMLRILRNNGKSNSRIYKLVNFGIVVKKNGQGYSITTGLPSYTIYLDKGRKPGKQPPMKNILEWCKRKGINKKWAFPIARKIGRMGLPGTGFLDPLRNFRSTIPELKEAFKKDIKEKISEQFKTEIQ